MKRVQIDGDVEANIFDEGSETAGVILVTREVKDICRIMRILRGHL